MCDMYEQHSPGEAVAVAESLKENRGSPAGLSKGCAEPICPHGRCCRKLSKIVRGAMS